MHYNSMCSSSVLVSTHNNSLVVYDIHTCRNSFSMVYTESDICNNSTLVGAMWPPKFAEASLDREPAAS